MKSLVTVSLVLLSFFFSNQDLVSQTGELTTDRKTISFQGFISKENQNESSSVEVTFSMYESITSKKVIWSESQLIRPEKGLFTVELGNKVALPNSLPNQIWLGLSKDNNEFARLKINHVPFAINANTALFADSLKGGAVSSINGVNGALSFIGKDGLEVRNSENGSISIGLSETTKGELTLNQGTEWLLAGNTNATFNSWLGTFNQVPLIIRTNNMERMRVNASNGFVGINDNNPNGNLSIGGNLVIRSIGKNAQLTIETPQRNNSTNFFTRPQNSIINYYLPERQGLPNTFLLNDGNGNLSWYDGGLWSDKGNNINLLPNAFIGTTSNHPFRIRTNNTERMIVTESGMIGINNGNAAPQQRLDVYGSISLRPSSSDLGKLIIQGNNGKFSSFRNPLNSLTNIEYILPSSDGSNGGMLITNGSGVLSWSSAVNATNINASGNLTVGGNTTLGNANSDITSLNGTLRVYDSDASNYTDIKGGSGAIQVTNLNLILPTNAGSPNSILTTDGNGNLSWSSNVAGSNLNISGNLSVGGNTDLGNDNSDVTSLYGKFRVYDSDASNYTDILGPLGTAQTLNLNLILPINSGSNGQVLSTDGSGNLSWVTATPDWASPGTIGSSTPNTGAFTSLSANNNLSLAPTGSGAGNTGEIRWYELLANGTNYTAFKAADAMNANITYTLPAADGTSGQVLSTNGSGNLSWVTATPDWASPGTIGSSTPNTGAFTSLSANNNLSLAPTGSGAGNTGEIRWYELLANGTNYTAFKAADAMNANITYTLPAADGTSGQVLSTNGSGILSWSSSSTDWTTPGTIGSTTPNTGTFTSLSANNNLTLSPTGSGAGNTGEIRWYELLANGTNYTAFKAADAMNANVTYTLPAADGASGQFLKTDGAGNLSWSPSGSGVDASSLQSYPISSAAPSAGQALMWNAGTSNWEPQLPTTSIQKFILTEGTAIDIDALDAANIDNQQIEDLAISDHAFFRMINSSAITTITGFGNGENGRIIYLLNTSGTAVKLENQSTASLPANRLSLGSYNLLSLGNNQTATLIWSSTVDRWVLLSTN